MDRLENWMRQHQAKAMWIMFALGLITGLGITWLNHWVGN